MSRHFFFGSCVCCLFFAIGWWLGDVIYPTGTVQAEGVDFGPPARSYEELKQERERFGPRGDRNPRLKPGEHPDDPDYSSKKRYRVSFWGPGLVSPKVWEVNQYPWADLETGGIRFSVDGKYVVLGSNWMIEEL
jgi:hypothetical protein